MAINTTAFGFQGPEVAALQQSLVTLCQLKPDNTLKEFVKSRFGDVNFGSGGPSANRERTASE
jgi:hypothetical protein